MEDTQKTEYSAAVMALVFLVLGVFAYYQFQVVRMSPQEEIVPQSAYLGLSENDVAKIQSAVKTPDGTVQLTKEQTDAIIKIMQGKK